jgi:hypothetical protein
MDSFKAVLIKDARIADITSQEVYGVVSGGSQSTQQQIAATSASTSSIVFQVQVPSENIVIDRNVLIQSNLNFNIYIREDVPNGELAFNYGETDAFQVFPLNSLFTTSSCTINNTNVSANTQDIFAQLTRMNSARELYRYNSTSPSLPDSQWGVYSDAIAATNNPLGGFANNSLDLDFDPRGAFPCAINVSHYVGGNLVDESLVSTGAGAAGGEYWVVNVETIVTEPLFGLSPFTWCDPEFSSQGILGVNNMSLVFNIDASCKRLWSSATDYITSISLTQQCFSNSQLLFTYLSLQPTDVVSTKNVCPYMDYPRFISNTTQTLPAWDPALGQPQYYKLTSNSIQLNQVPDKMIIVARIPMSQQDWNNTSSFLPIQNIVCNFNNQSGILSSATQVDLWKMSMRNGSSQNYNEFFGEASVTNGEGVGTLVPTTGAMLVINPTIDFGLPNYLSAGSQGNFNFQFNLSVYNTLPTQVTPELVLICCNSGIMVTSQGVSNLYTGMLTKELVLKTNESTEVDPISTIEYQRLVGGKVCNQPLTALHKIYKKRKGGVMSAGGMSGGESSGGIGHFASSGGVHCGKKPTKRAHKI